MGKLRIEYVPVDRIKPYEKNPRLNADAVPYIVSSIKEFDFQNPLLLDKNLVVICGHTRLLAAKELGMTELPCIIAKDMSPEKAKAFRLAENSLNALSGWDFDLLQDELGELKEFGFDMEDFGFIDYDAIDDMPVAPDDARTQERETQVEYVEDAGQGIPIPGQRQLTVTVFCDDDDQYVALRDMLDTMGFRYR